MTCVYSEYLGCEAREGVEYINARCPHCGDTIEFAALARHRQAASQSDGAVPRPVAEIPTGEHE